jgi:hypothetical protein
MVLASPLKRLPSHRIILSSVKLDSDAPLMGFVLVCAPPPTYPLHVYSTMLLPASLGPTTAR